MDSPTLADWGLTIISWQLPLLLLAELNMGFILQNDLCAALIIYLSRRRIRWKPATVDKARFHNWADWTRWWNIFALLTQHIQAMQCNRTSRTTDLLEDLFLHILYCSETWSVFQTMKESTQNISCTHYNTIFTLHFIMFRHSILWQTFSTFLMSSVFLSSQPHQHIGLRGLRST
jgi:hypothetical protein